MHRRLTGSGKAEGEPRPAAAQDTAEEREARRARRRTCRLGVMFGRAILAGSLGAALWIGGCMLTARHSSLLELEWPYRPLNLLLFMLACGVGGALIGDWLDRRPHEPWKPS